MKNLYVYHSYCPRAMFYLPDKKLLYVSVSKAGNTSIKASMFDIPEKDDYRQVHSAVRQFDGKAKALRIHEFDDYFKFTFVRNPFDRLVSCYENKFHTDKESLGKSIESLIYENYLFGFLAKDRGFSSFARRVCRIPDRLADRHFISQCFGILDDRGELLIDYAGKFENFHDDFEGIREKYDLKPLPHYNKASKQKKNWMDYYDLKTARRVYKRYRKDIELFGYQADYDRLIEYLASKA